VLDSRSSSFRSDVQVLRALAVLLVILFHAKVPGFQGGFLGVDIFFVISGFWMSQIILTQLNKGTFSFKRFYERRMRRILPALFFTLLLTFVVGWFELWPRDFDTMSEVMAAAVLFLANAVIKNQASDYFAPELDSHPLLHVWSLSLEEQYYLIFPLLALLVYKLNKKSSLALFLLIPVVSFWAANAYYHQNPTAIFYHLPTRLWEFWLGYFAAVWVLQKRDIHWMAYVTALLVLFASILLVDEKSIVPGWGSLSVCLATAILLARGHKEFSVFTPKAIVLVWIGGLSYSIYLLHQPILSFARLRGLDNPYLLLVVVLAISVPVAVFMKRYMEDPFRNVSIVSTKQFISSTVVVGSLIVALAYWSVSTNGLPGRFDGLLESITKTAHGSPERKWCHDNEVKDACVHVLDVEPSVAVLGDSHAAAMAYAVGEALEKNGRSALHLSVSGCGFYDLRERCNQWYEDALRRIEESASIKTVVISTRSAGQLHGNHKGIWPEVPNLTTEEHQFKVLAAYTSVFDRLLAAKKKVIWILQVPEVGPKLELQMRRALDDAGNAESVSKQWWVERMKYVRAYAKSVSNKVSIYDPEEIFCDESICYAVRDGVTMYRDRDHMSLSAAELIAGKIESQL